MNTDKTETHKPCSICAKPVDIEVAAQGVIENGCLDTKNRYYCGEACFNEASESLKPGDYVRVLVR